MDGERLHIESSPLKIILLAGLALGFVAAGAWMVSVAPGGSFVQFVGWASILFFGFVGFVGLRQMLAFRGVVVTIDPTGILDRRVSDQPIPWAKVLGVDVWSLDAQRFVILKLDPAFDAVFPTKAITRLTRGANKKLGADGVAINPQGLKISFDMLLAAIVRFKTEWDDGNQKG
jgi:hypothetical protein